MPQKVAGAAGGGGGKSTCASTVEAAQRSDMPLLTTMAADVANFTLLFWRLPGLACGASVLGGVALGFAVDCRRRELVPLPTVANAVADRVAAAEREGEGREADDSGGGGTGSCVGS